jgi:hypothetical protein
MKKIINKVIALSTLSLVSINATAATAICVCYVGESTIACLCAIF